MNRTRWIATAIAATIATTGAIGAGIEAEEAPQAAAATRARTDARPADPRAMMPRGIPAAVLLPETQALFDGYVRDGKMPGIVAAYGLGRLPTLYPAAGKIGPAPDSLAAGPDSLWRVYSMTKPITAAAAMILIEEGKIGLDDPVSKYIPAFARMTVLTSPDTSLDAVPAKSPITIRELLTHTSGLGYNINAKGPILKLYEAKGILPAEVNAATEAEMRKVRPATLEEFANRVASVPLIYQPGTKWHYSIGLDVMGRVIEVASGMPFDRFVDTRIFAPLRMTSSFWTVPGRDINRLATTVAFVGDKMVPFDPPATSPYMKPPSFPYGGAGLVMSARDYDRFLHMLQNYGELEGVRVMQEATARQMMSNLLPNGVTFPGIGNVNGNGNGDTATRAAQIGYGAGGTVYLTDGPGGFPAKGTYGWGGAAGTIAFVDPARRARATIMVNYFPGEKWPLREQAVAALAKDIAKFRK
jgi:CubicO group peptidase (beta-lactamase class C family)